MRIAIDGRGVNWYNGTGIGTYTENLLTELITKSDKNYFHIYWSGDNYERFNNYNSKIVMTSQRHKKFFQQNYFPANIQKEKIDIFHVPQNGIGLSEKVCCKKVITIHDLIPYIMPETVGKKYLLEFIKTIPSLVENCDGILTVSECSKRDILKFFPIDESKIYVTPLAADKKYTILDNDFCTLELERKLNITKPFILYVGGFSPRKNVRSLIMAFHKIYKDFKNEFKLVIVGSLKEEGRSLKELSDNLDMTDNIIFTGFVNESLLPLLYNAATAFVYPSFYEGFGLPPLEAMSCGTPVITSKTSSMSEIAEDSALLIDPYDTSSLINALNKLLSNTGLMQNLKNKSLNKAAEFSWKSTAEKTLNAYASILTL